MLWGQFSTVPKKDSEGKMIKAKNPPIVDDPYYGGKGGFEQTFKQCKSYSKNFLAYVIEDLIGSSEQIEFPENLFTWQPGLISNYRKLLSVIQILERVIVLLYRG